MRVLVYAVSALALLPLAGCGTSTDGRLPTYKVSGSVTYKGQPLADADVILQFAEHDKASFGRTNSSGQFTLGTYENADGALAGEALITVAKWEVFPTSPAPVAGEPGYDPSKAYLSEKQGKLLVPQKYTSFATSGLKAVIEASDRNSPLTLELAD